MPAISFQSVSKEFKHGSSINKVLNGITFNANNREFVSIVGPSGCGKTTILKLISGLSEPDGGRITIFDKRPVDASRNRLFGMVFQDLALFPWLTAAENVALPIKIKRDSAYSDQSIIRALSAVGLGDFAKHFPDQLSGGMKQKLALARCLVINPKIMLLDEPFANLDELTRHKLDVDLSLLFENSTKPLSSIVLVTHSIDEAVFLSDKVIVVSGPPSKVMEIVNIPLERPRKKELRHSKKFFELTGKIRQLCGG